MNDLHPFRERKRLPTMNRKILISIVALGLFGLAAPVAGAETVGVDGSGAIVVTAGAGEQNDLGFQANGTGDGRLVIYDPGASSMTVTSNSCAQTDSSSVVCDWNPAVGARADLGDGNDSGYVSFDLPKTAPFTIAGGPGDDHLQASSDGQPTLLDGGPGNDRLDGAGGSDTLIGGDGNDVLQGRGGSDRLDGGPGEDNLSGDGNKDPAPDVIDGGPGTDTIDSDWEDSGSVSQRQPLSLTLAGGADDGRPGEGDDVRNVERVISYTESRLVGTDAAEYLETFQTGGPSTLVGDGGDDVLKGGDGPDTIDGGSGSDTIVAGYGDDQIVGGPGRDTIDADRSTGDCGPLWCKYPYGNDTVDVRDGELDSVTCGGGQDTVYADPIDVVSPDCETGIRSGSGNGSGSGGAGSGGGGGNGGLAVVVVRAKLSRVLARGLIVRLTAPGAGRVSAVASSGRQAVASGSQRVAKAGPVTVVLRFSRAARLRRIHASRLKLTLSLRFSGPAGASTKTISTTVMR